MIARQDSEERDAAKRRARKLRVKEDLGAMGVELLVAVALIGLVAVLGAFLNW